MTMTEDTGTGSDPAADPGDRHCPALNRLRAATRSLHDGVEATGAADRIMRPGVTRADYRDFLLRTLAAVAPAESWLAQACPAMGIADPAGGQRRAALTADIRALGGGRPPDGPAAVTEAALAESPACRGSVLGCLYVLEGSALGGAMIARHMVARFGLEAEGFTRFHGGAFQSVGAMRAGDRWRTVRGLLTGLDGAELAAAERTAVGLFHGFLDAYRG